MIWQLVKREPVWRRMPLAILSLSAAFSLWHFFAPPDRSGPPTILLATSFGMLTAVALAGAFVQGQDTFFQAALPITVRQIFLARLISLASFVWAPLLSSLAVMAILKDPVLAGLPLAFWFTFPCLLFVLQCVVIRRVPLPGLTIPIGVAGIQICATLQVQVPHLVDAACWVITAGIILRTWQVVPSSFQSAPLPKSQSKATTLDKTPRVPQTKSLFWTVLRSHGFGFLVIVPAMLLGTSNPFLWIFLGTQWVGFRNRSRWLLTLPIPPRILLAVAAAPLLLALCAAYEFGIHLPSFPNPYLRGISLRASQEPGNPGKREESALAAHCETPNVKPSLEYWAPVRPGASTLIRAPWGESFQPPPFRILNLDAYNPYAVGCNNTHRFLEWQYDRATLAVYGRALPLDRGRDLRDATGAISTARTQLLTIVSIVGFSLLSLLIAMFFDWYPVHRFSKSVRITLMTLVGLSAAAFLWWIDADNQQVVQWLSWTLPVNPVAAASIAILALFLIWVAMARIFSQLEFVDKPVPAVRPQGF